MKKILSFAVVLTMITAFAQPMLVTASENIENEIVIDQVPGISREQMTEVDPVQTEAEFNYTLDSIRLNINGNEAFVETDINDKHVVFHPTLHASQLTYNANNTVFGTSSEISENFQLYKFTVEENADGASLMKPNLHMAGNTVVSLAFYSMDDNQIYYFQFICNDIQMPSNLETEPEMAEYEMANFAAQPYEEVKEDLDSVDLEINEDVLVEKPEEMPLEEVVPIEEALTDIMAPSKESQKLDAVIKRCEDGPVSVDPRSRALVPNIPDSLYKSQTSGWQTKKNAYVAEGSNAKRSNGYVIYHMPDYMSGNALNYAMRYEAVVNYNWSAQRFIHSVRITHNLWVQYIKSQNKTYIFDNRAWNARITTEGTSYVESTAKKGYFTHFEQSAISQGSMVGKVLNTLISWVPYLGQVQQLSDTFTSGTKITTGTVQPTSKYAKRVSSTVKNLIRPGDHITIVGTGSSVNSFTHGYSITCSVK